MITGVSSPPKSQEAIKTADREYRRTQLHVIEQCTPGETFSPEPDGERMVDSIQSDGGRGFANRHWRWTVCSNRQGAGNSAGDFDDGGGCRA